MGGNIAKRAFTLVEIMLTIALMTLLTSVFVLNVNGFLQQGAIETLQDEFWRAVEEAKKSAVYEQKPKVLAFDEDKQAFLVVSGESVQEFPLKIDNLDDLEIEVVFNQVLPAERYVLIRGQQKKLNEIARVIFHPDGTCTPFVVQMTVAETTIDIPIDPWTGAELLMPEDTK